jgi:hypothetical protein
MGHYDHGEGTCDENLEDFPPKGMFVEKMFSRKDTYTKLHLLYLEQNCSLTYWIDVKL